MHSKRRPHECNICDLRYLREKRAKIALKEVHAGGKLIHSNYCDKKFQLKENSQKDKQYKCDVCEKRFSF